MIGFLRGRVVRVRADSVVLEAGGVGYLVAVPATTRERLGGPGSQAEVHVHTYVREDQLALFGFASPEELEFFQQLIQVDGVGPKGGLAILDTASLDLLKSTIAAGDGSLVRRAKGIGAKTAQKVIIEFQSRLQAEAALEAVAATSRPGELPRQVEQALRGLGFSAQQAKIGVEAVQWTGEPGPQEALAAALRGLGR